MSVAEQKRGNRRRFIQPSVVENRLRRSVNFYACPFYQFVKEWAGPRVLQHESPRSQWRLEGVKGCNAGSQRIASMYGLLNAKHHGLNLEAHLRHSCECIAVFKIKSVVTLLPWNVPITLENKTAIARSPLDQVQRQGFKTRS